MNMPNGFKDANASPAIAVGGIGDVTSAERGSGARFNAGKAPIDLIPLQLIVDTFDHVTREDFDGTAEAMAYDVLAELGAFQRTGDARHLDRALRHMRDHWVDCARVFDYGRRKYAAWNWAKGMPWSAVMGCAGRHGLAILAGEYSDPESGQNHAGHLLCNLVMLRTYVDTFPEGNDLPSPDLFSARAAA